MKKYLALLLAVLMLAMTACGSSGSGGESTTSAATTQAPAETTSGAAAETEPAEEDILAPLGEKNFGGQAFVILDANDYPDMHINMPGKELSGDTIKDAIWNRDALIEDKYRCDIQYVQMTNADVGITALRNSNHAGDKAYDICISTVSGGRLSTLATQGVLANLCDFEELTLDIKRRGAMLLKKRPELRTMVDSELLSRYEMILKKNAGTPLVCVDADKCGHCHLRLTPQTLASARSGAVTLCDNCMHIIYIDDSAEA